MGVTEFDTKVAVVVRESFATWQRLNVTAFLISGVCAQSGPAAIGEDYIDALRAPHRDADAILRGVKRHP